MTVYAFIPARSGSTRIQNKNLQEVGGRSLLTRTMSVACGVADRTVLSTDCERIAQHIRGADHASLHKRPASLAGPSSQIEGAIDHWFKRAVPRLDDHDVIVLLQPTSPFRTEHTVRECISLCEQGWSAALTVTMECRNTGRIRSHLDGPKRVLWNRPPTTRPRSQDARRHAVENGVCWAFTAAHWRTHRNRMGGPTEAIVTTSWLEAFEIDTPEELEAARALAGGLSR